MIFNVNDNLIIIPAEEKFRNTIMDILETSNMHYIPSAEVEYLHMSDTYLAIYNGAVVGMCGYHMIGEKMAKTTLMSVLPKFKGEGIGFALQEFRMALAYKKHKAKYLKTLSDRPTVIEWYKKHFGYVETEKVAKVHEFGDPSINEWTVMYSCLTTYFQNNIDLINNKYNKLK